MITTDKIPQEMQCLIITFSDGVVAQFPGKAVTYPGDTRTITSVRFTPPEPLPEDMQFIPIKSE
jgi:hypothetical protein